MVACTNSHRERSAITLCVSLSPAVLSCAAVCAGTRTLCRAPLCAQIDGRARIRCPQRLQRVRLDAVLLSKIKIRMRNRIRNQTSTEESHQPVLIIVVVLVVSKDVDRCSKPRSSPDGPAPSPIAVSETDMLASQTKQVQF